MTRAGSGTRPRSITLAKYYRATSPWFRDAPLSLFHGPTQPRGRRPFHPSTRPLHLRRCAPPVLCALGPGGGGRTPEPTLAREKGGPTCSLTRRRVGAAGAWLRRCRHGGTAGSCEHAGPKVWRKEAGAAPKRSPGGHRFPRVCPRSASVEQDTCRDAEAIIARPASHWVGLTWIKPAQAGPEGYNPGPHDAENPGPLAAAHGTPRAQGQPVTFDSDSASPAWS